MFQSAGRLWLQTGRGDLGAGNPPALTPPSPTQFTASAPGVGERVGAHFLIDCHSKACRPPTALVVHLSSRVTSGNCIPSLQLRLLTRNSINSTVMPTLQDWCTVWKFEQKPRWKWSQERGESSSGTCVTHCALPTPGGKREPCISNWKWSCTTAQRDKERIRAVTAQPMGACHSQPTRGHYSNFQFPRIDSLQQTLPSQLKSIPLLRFSGLGSR